MTFLFSVGQKNFAMVFALLFLVVITLAYRRDFKYTSRFFKSPYLILIGIMFFMAMILFLAQK